MNRIAAEQKGQDEPLTDGGCRNCGTSLPAGAGFCPACGQSVREVSRPWLGFAREALDEMFDLDGRMMRTMRLLLTRPGFLTRAYLDGRRVAYTPPIRMYLLISLGFFLLLPMILPAESAVYPGHRFSVDLYSKAMFLLLPVFAVLLKLFYRRFFYIDHLVFSVHLFSAMFIVFAPLLSIETLADRYLWVGGIQLLFLLYMMAYTVIALRTAYAESTFKSVAKFLALLFLFLPILGAAIEAASHYAA